MQLASREIPSHPRCRIAKERASSTNNPPVLQLPGHVSGHTVCNRSPEIYNLDRMSIRCAARHSLLHSSTIKVLETTHHYRCVPYASDLRNAHAKWHANPAYTPRKFRCNILKVDYHYVAASKMTRLVIGVERVSTTYVFAEHSL